MQAIKRRLQYAPQKSAVASIAEKLGGCPKNGGMAMRVNVANMMIANNIVNGEVLREGV